MQTDCNRRDIIVIGGSAGAGEALFGLLSALPATLPAALLILLHRSWPFETPDPFQRWTANSANLPVHLAYDGQRIEAGNIYLPPAESSMFVELDLVRIQPILRSALFHSGIDTLFRSAAEVYGPRVVAVLLSGMMSDGREGLWQIREHGGLTIVQDPECAKHPDMPRNAIADIPVHSCLSIPQIAIKLVEATAGTYESAAPASVRVLIVEDERIVALNLETRLRELGYTVTGSVASAEEALQSVAAVLPDLVLMDIHLSGKLKGTEAGQALWERHQLPIVYTTAYADEETLETSRPSMPYGYIVKPYRPVQIHAAIQIALQQHRLRSQGAVSQQQRSKRSETQAPVRDDSK